MKYFGVLGNRDHIKINGEKRPFHEFLDIQPDGWLTSLVYAKGFHRPENSGPMIFDCGAWSYRNEDTPPINVESVIDNYTQMCNPGDICVAPDHMLLPDSNIWKRQRFNETSAAQFIQKLSSHLVPMACVHGLGEDERADQASYYESMGYKHIAIGGIAARSSQPKYCIDVVERVVNAVTRNTHVHVMGLSSPNYYREWERIGVDSCDGSSHFKQAFTAGAFFSLDWSGKLVKHQAARRDNDSVLPNVHCDCKVCGTMRKHGVDTRSYGSNEHNMGRAVHNMNMLMIAQAAYTKGIKYLISCVSKKANKPTLASEIYKSPWFLKAKDIAVKYGGSWGILSAKHGLLFPCVKIAPYDETLPTSGDCNWASNVATAIQHGHEGEAIFILAGTRYRKHLVELLRHAGIPHYAPLSGMGIGRQLAAMTPPPDQGKLI